MCRARIRIAGIAAVFSVLTIGLAASPSLAADGAFAVDEATGRYGYSWNEKNERRAEEAALKGCASDKCKIVFRTKSGQCGAIATAGDGKVWGGAARPKRDAAEKAALDNCQKRAPTGQCKLRGAECNK